LQAHKSLPDARQKHFPHITTGPNHVPVGAKDFTACHDDKAQSGKTC